LTAGSFVPRACASDSVILEPESYNRVRNVLKESKLIYEYEKFVLQALYYVAREDKIIAGQILRLILSDDVIKNSSF
jgi:3-dehydroquinate synthetase